MIEIIRNRVLPAALAIVMSLSLFPAALAEETEDCGQEPAAEISAVQEENDAAPDDGIELILNEQDMSFAEELHTLVYINPVYEDILTEQDILALTETDDLSLNGPLFGAIPGYEAPEFYSVYDVAMYVKSEIKKHTASIPVYFTMSESFTVDAAFFSEIYRLMYIHTGVPDEGDYLRFQIGGGRNRFADPWTEERNGATVYCVYLLIEPGYYTTAEEEAAVDSFVAAFIADRNLASGERTVPEKIHAVYDYLRYNVTYDFSYPEGITSYTPFTAYAAAVKGCAVCQGYSLLFYRLMLELGIDARVVSSTAISHAWNIVLLDSAYYELDATWEATQNLPSVENLRFFLRGSTWWRQSSTHNGVGMEYNDAAFAAAYPLHTDDYDLSSIAPHCCIHVAAADSTCEGHGNIEHYRCIDCGNCWADAERKTAIDADDISSPPLGHNYQHGYCTRCGAADESFIPVASITVSETETVCYDSVEDAVNSAVSGQTVRLTGNVGAGEGNLVIKPGVCLDLNGHSLTAKTVVSFGSISDSSEDLTDGYAAGSGLLAVGTDCFVYMSSANSVAAGNAQMPYYAAGEGFRFATVTRFGSKWSQTLNAQGQSKFIFYPVVKDWTNTIWRDILAADSGVGVYISAEIKTAEDTLIYEFVYTDELMSAWAAGIDNTGCGTFVLKAKADDAISSISVRPYVKSSFVNISICGEGKTTAANTAA